MVGRGKETAVEYASMAEAERHLGLNDGSVSKSCKTGCKAGNFRFEKLPDYPDVDGEVWVPMMIPVVATTATFKPSDPERIPDTEYF